ncbi:MAG: protein kinase, partial [Myxococcales bacterium]|nr:protein kinase [Myxococcales bacterium]
GSPAYMAPELISGRPLDHRTDLFSLGILLYQLATGRLPFTGRNPHQVLKRIMDAEYADPRRVNPTIGGRLRAIIIKALEREPADRYQSAKELRAALEAFVAEAGIGDPEQTLAAYLSDPETVSVELKKETIDRLIERGQRASDAGDVPSALDCYNRVLALDDGNQRVLKLIERVGMDKRRRAMMQGGAGLVVFGLAAGGIAWFVATRPPDPTPDPRPVPIVAEGEADAGGEAIAVVEDSGPASAPDAAIQLAQAAPDAGPGEEPVNVVRPIVAVEHPPATREVRLIPSISDVLVNVDGHDHGRFMADVTTLPLRVGRHRVVLTPRGDLASEYPVAQLDVNVPPGPDEYELRLPVRPYDAKLSIITNAPEATVTIRLAQGGTLTGNADSILYVPLRTSPQSVSITVSAPGYTSVEVARRVRGVPSDGATTEVQIPLEREGERAQAP